jgi:multicomponent Na+:H+ antiporter subunit D
VSALLAAGSLGSSQDAGAWLALAQAGSANASPLIALAVVIPLCLAALAAARPAPRQTLLVIGGLGVWNLSSVLLWRHTQAHGVVHYALGGWAEPLGIGLRADGLAASLAMLTAVIAGGCAAYRLSTPDAEMRGTAMRWFWPLFFLLGAALNAVWLAADLFNMYVGLELLGLSAVGLVAVAGTSTALAAALRYLLAALLGSLAYLLGVALLYAEYGSLALSSVASGFAPTTTTFVALGFITAGLCLKTALFPLHGWLPPAHAAALPPVSALLSALVVKASFVMLLRIWLGPGGPLLTPVVAQGLGLLGAGAIVWGGWQAVQHADLKMLVAHSTVAQLGYLFVAIPLLVDVSHTAREFAWDGLMLQIVSHALAKSAMFLASGTLIAAVGSGRVADLAGVSRHMPLALFAFGLAAVSLMGLPPSGGFSAKWLLLQAALAGGQWHWVIVLLAGGLLTAGYVFRVFRISFLQGADDHFSATPLGWDVVALLLAGAAIGLGLLSTGPLDVMRFGALLQGRGA